MQFLQQPIPQKADPVCGYVTAIAEGRYANGYRMHEPPIRLLPFVDVCVVRRVKSIAAVEIWMPRSRLLDGWAQLRRANPPVIEVEQRTASIDIVEEQFPEEMA